MFGKFENGGWCFSPEQQDGMLPVEGLAPGEKPHKYMKIEGGKIVVDEVKKSEAAAKEIEKENAKKERIEKKRNIKKRVKDASTLQEIKEILADAFNEIFEEPPVVSPSNAVVAHLYIDGKKVGKNGNENRPKNPSKG